MSSANATRTPLSGTRPAGAEDEIAAARQVREMFSRIAPRYDLLNHLLSLQFDRLWRQRVTRRFRHILSQPDARVLDLCCGTGDLTLALARAGAAAVFGSDFAHPMLVRALEKSASRQKGSSGPNPDAVRSSGLARNYAEADTLQLPFPDASFDLVTAAFGFRNLANYQRGLHEILRVLKADGEVGILDFAEPGGRLFGPLYRFYFRRILPRLGGLVSGNSMAYSYLPSSVAKFPEPEELAALMLQAGFSAARYELWTGGIVVLHIGRKAAENLQEPQAATQN